MNRLGAFVAAVLLVAASALVLGGPAQGLEYEGITAREGETIEKDYGPIPAQNPVLSENPDLCKTDPWCAYVPLTIEYPPGFNPEGDDFTVTVEMSWDAVDAEATFSNDLDMYIWELPYDGEAEPAQEYVGSGASSSNPEKANLFRPTAGTYAILVNNFAGVNSGFSLKTTYVGYPIPRVFESLEPPVNQQGSGTDSEALDRPAPPGTDLGLDLGSDLSPVPPAFGEALAAAGDEAYAFAAPPAADQLPPQPEGPGAGARRSNSDPVSGGTVAAWLLGSAVVVVAASVIWFARNRPTAMRYA